MEVKDPQKEKTWGPICVIVDGIVKEEKPHPWKRPWLNDVRLQDASNVTDARLQHPANTVDSIVVTLLGMCTDVRCEQFWNADDWIVVRVEGKVTAVTSARPKNAIL